MKTPIQDCKKLFKYLCPKKWENLEPTEREKVRFCNSCRKNVYLCSSEEEAESYSGVCIALEIPTTVRATSSKFRVGDSAGATRTGLSEAEMLDAKKEYLREQESNNHDE